MQDGPRSTIRHYCILRASHEGLVGLQHGFQFFVGVNAILEVGLAFVLLSLSRQTTKRSRRQPKLLFLLSPIASHVGCRDTLHSEYFNLVTGATRERILNTETITLAGKTGIRRYLRLRIELVDLLDVNCEATRGVEFSGAMATLEVLSLLMLHQNYAWTLVNLGRLSFCNTTVPFSSSKSRSQYQHHGRRTWICNTRVMRVIQLFVDFTDVFLLLLDHNAQRVSASNVLASSTIS